MFNGLKGSDGGGVISTRKILEKQNQSFKYHTKPILMILKRVNRFPMHLSASIISLTYQDDVGEICFELQPNPKSPKYRLH